MPALFIVIPTSFAVREAKQVLSLQKIKGPWERNFSKIGNIVYKFDHGKKTICRGTTSWSMMQTCLGLGENFVSSHLHVHSHPQLSTKLGFLYC